MSARWSVGSDVETDASNIQALATPTMSVRCADSGVSRGLSFGKNRRRPVAGTAVAVEARSSAALVARAAPWCRPLPSRDAGLTRRLLGSRTGYARRRDGVEAVEATKFAWLAFLIVSRPSEH